MASFCAEPLNNQSLKRRPAALLVTRLSIYLQFEPYSARTELKTEVLLAIDSAFGPYKKSGRGPPTAPTLRPRVLTPRDHFVHRGGERMRIMQ